MRRGGRWLARRRVAHPPARLAGRRQGNSVARRLAGRRAGPTQACRSSGARRDIAAQVVGDRCADRSCGGLVRNRAVLIGWLTRSLLACAAGPGAAVGVQPIPIHSDGGPCPAGLVAFQGCQKLQPVILHSIIRQFSGAASQPPTRIAKRPNGDQTAKERPSFWK